MKRFILFFILMFVISSTTAFAEGEYDGIWFTPMGYISIHENDGVLGAIQLQPDTKRWALYVGELKGNEVRYSSVPLTAADPMVVIDVVYDSDTTSTATGVSCEPVELCAEFQLLIEQLDGQFVSEKIW